MSNARKHGGEARNLGEEQKAEDDSPHQRQILHRRQPRRLEARKGVGQHGVGDQRQ